MVPPTSKAVFPEHCSSSSSTLLKTYFTWQTQWQFCPIWSMYICRHRLNSFGLFRRTWKHRCQLQKFKSMKKTEPEKKKRRCRQLRVSVSDVFYCWIFEHLCWLGELDIWRRCNNIGTRSRNQSISYDCCQSVKILEHGKPKILTTFCISRKTKTSEILLNSIEPLLPFIQTKRSNI